eukprot:4687292-Amphidinium_carterae.1
MSDIQVMLRPKTICSGEYPALLICVFLDAHAAANAVFKSDASSMPCSCKSAATIHDKTAP